ncbi:hypothetical protein HK100_004399 [Physocladia obscura]|uniref:NADP-dependent oxidoreductase domain-containing protein n=1 Tax=Physocladia obscura TaxID=109957 RepID=A0AAD5X8S2_9FUNG|nr:hypothetical protein HK100_004399 [Physocladia obscura]
MKLFEEPLVSRIGFGAMGLSHTYGIADRAESLTVLQHVADSKATFIDTSDLYGFGHNEELIGEWIAQEKGNREKVFICTKFGVKSRIPYVISGKPEYVKKACNASLKRLGVDTIDLYYQHRVDPDTPIEETVTAMAELVNEGKVRYIGLSEASAETIRRAHKVHPIAAVQVEYSPWSTDIENNGVLSTCNELGIVVVACLFVCNMNILRLTSSLPVSPIGRGFLTGQYKSIEDFELNDMRRSVPRFQGAAFAENLKLVDALKKIANEKGCTVTQLTLAWVCAQGQQIIPIPGTKKVSRLEENLGALNVVISESENAEIRKIISSIPVVGERYAPATLALSWK